MSVNYYAFGPFPGGDDTGEGLHIGQAAGSWRFLHRSHPDLGLTTSAAWSAFIRQQGVTVRAESGYDITPEEMDVYMTEKRDSFDRPRKPRFGARTDSRLLDGDHLDPDGHAFHAGDFC